MGSGEGPVSPRSTSRRYRRSPGDDADEASSSKRQKRGHHHRHDHGDRGDQEAGSRSRMSAAKPGEGEVQDGEILDDATASRGPDADFGKAGLVFCGLAPAPEYDGKSDATVVHASRLASDSSKKYDVSANKRKSDDVPHEPENGVFCSSDRKYSKHNEPSERISRFPKSKREREIEHKDAEVDDTEVRSGLGCLVSRKEINVMQNGGDERHARSKVSQIEDHSVGYSYSRKRSEAHHMDYREASSQAQDLRNVVSGASEHENGDRCIELDRYSARRQVNGRGSYKERERSRDRQSSSTRHKDDERREDKTNDSCKVTDIVGSRRVMEKLSGTEEKCREADHRRKRSEEIKEESCKEEDQGDFEHLAKQEEDDLKKTKEEARKRMNTILEKHRQRQLQKQQQGPVLCLDSIEVTSLDRDAAATEVKDANSVTVMPDGKIENNHESSNMVINKKSYTLWKSPPTQPNISINLGISGDRRSTGVSGFQEGIPMGDRSSDMLCGDIFGVSPIRVQKLGNLDGMHIRKNLLRDNWDDEHGYYKYHLGEVIDGRYRITAGYGKGVFSTVVQAKDLKAGKNDPEEVAIKITETMTQKKGTNLVRGRFLYWKSCQVQIVKTNDTVSGLKLTAVRTYSKQLFIALKHLKDCSILHCDIKPDNILVNGSKNLLKLCDFGSALPAGINDITPILVSRFYRAPEIILGLPYDHSLDMWSVGCCLYELYTGKILFPGGTNNGMLWLHMELKGPFPKKMLRKGAFTTQHFDQNLNFHATDEKLMMKKAVNELRMNVKPKGVGPKISSFAGEDPKMLSRFKDLLEKIFVLDPQKRLTVSQALSHPFITGK